LSLEGVVTAVTSAITGGSVSISKKGDSPGSLHEFKRIKILAKNK
tara:strand:- start:573 stop:707 length:135 start_codon:yes stop_codon:yes gene_type:complete